MDKQLEELNRKLLANDFEPSLNYTFEMVRRRSQERKLESLAAFKKLEKKARQVSGIWISQHYDYLGESLIKNQSFPELKIYSTLPTREPGDHDLCFYCYVQFGVKNSGEGESYIERSYVWNCAGLDGHQDCAGLKEKLDKFFNEHAKLFIAFFKAYMNDRSFHVLRKLAALDKTADNLKKALANYSRKERAKIVVRND